MVASCQQMRKTHNKIGKILIDKKDLKNNVLLHRESSEPSTATRIKSVSKSSTKQSKSMERKRKNTEFIGTSKQSNDQSQTKEKSFWMTVWWNI